MKHTYHIKMRAALWAMLGIACLASALVMAAEPAWWTQQKRNCGLPSSLAYNNWDGKCNSSPGGSSSAPSYDYEAARRAQAAAAERQRQQEEAERIERERRAEEKRQKDAAFIRDRDAAANTLKGSAGTSTSRLKGISGTDNYGLKGSRADAGAQLKSVERHGRETSSQDIETASKTAQKGFDTPGKASGNLVYPDKNKHRQAPLTALDKKIPRGAQDDPQIKEMQTWYRKLDGQKAEKVKMIAEIKAQKKTGKDPVLDAKIATLNNDVKIITGNQTKATEIVEKRVKNLGFNLVESAEPGTTETRKK